MVKIGSVMTLRPPICTNTVECPIQVTAGRVRFACKNARSGATRERSIRQGCARERSSVGDAEIRLVARLMPLERGR